MHFLANSNFLQALGWAIINSLWQMAFLWIAFQTIITLGVRRSSVRAKLATALLGAGFAWFAYTLIYHWIIDPASMKRSLLAIGSFAAGNESWNTILQQVLPYASGVYLLLIILPAVQFVRNYRFVMLIRRSGLSKCDVDLRMFARRLGERMGIKKPVHVYLSDLIGSPVTIGFLKPMILMPVAAIANLSQSQLEAVLLHELAHIRRYDYLINLLVNLVKTVLYFNPFAAMFGKTIEREREKSCDEIVLQFPYDPHGYASALLMLQRNCAPHTAMAVAASGQRHDLLHRVEKILGIQRKPAPDFRKLAGLLAGLLCVVTLNALFFLSSPVIKNDSFAFTTVSNPFYQLVSDGKAEAVENSHLAKTASPAPMPLAKKAAAAKRFSLEPAIADQEYRLVQSASETTDGIALVDERVHAEPVLKKSQEEQVKGVVAATKKVLEQGQWKVVEKNVADALT
ncbi:MAG TPA: M56 family metallopeptidase, partial [Chitinophagaceae bacterium]